MVAASPMGQCKHGQALVKNEDGCLWVRSELRHNKGQQRTLATAGGAKDYRMTQVALVQVQPVGGAAICGQHRQAAGMLRVEGAGVVGVPCPGAGEWQKIGQVHGVDERPAHICPAIARVRAQPGFKSVNGLDPASKTQGHEQTPHFPGHFRK